MESISDSESDLETSESVCESSDSSEVVYFGPYPDYEAWQRGHIDYMGLDSFANIQLRLDYTIKSRR